MTWWERRWNPRNLTARHLARAVRQGRARVGDHSYGAPRLRFVGAARLVVGRFCSFADGVEIFLGGNHRTDFVTTYPFAEFAAVWPGARGAAPMAVSRGDVVIGGDVWVGSGARILSGVTIGPGAVIGAGAVVARDVAPYAVMAGNPAREARRRFDAATVARLLATAWWERDDATVARLAPLLQSADVGAVLAALE